jgi:hypothetical protein
MATQRRRHLSLLPIVCRARMRVCSACGRFRGMASRKGKALRGEHPISRPVPERRLDQGERRDGGRIGTQDSRAQR